MPQCPLCLKHTHDINHLFNCSQVPTQYHATSLRKKLLEAAAVIQDWESRYLPKPTKIKVKSKPNPPIIHKQNCFAFANKK